MQNLLGSLVNWKCRPAHCARLLPSISKRLLPCRCSVASHCELLKMPRRVCQFCQICQFKLRGHAMPCKSSRSPCL